ncbi:hypothetical protein E4U32_002301 [Claviceps aff. humidiphila group G2b]|nr:hypothetical protein E4U32_002301 [Claviceps aff. humidiphila group G2b]
MSPETRSPSSSAESVSSEHSEARAVVNRDMEVPFLAAMRKALLALRDLIEYRESQQEMAMADAEVYYPLGYNYEQWLRLVIVFREFSNSRMPRAYRGGQGALAQ